MPKLGKLQVDRLLRDGFEGNAWDSAVQGFGVRVRKGRASFFLKSRLGSRQLWISLGPYKSTTTQTRKGITTDQARAKAIAKLNEVGNGVDPTAAKRAKAAKQAAMPTFAEMAASYLKEGCGHLAPSTMEDRRSVLREGGPLLGAFGPVKLDAIGRRQLREWWASYVESAGVAPKTGRNWLDVISAIYAYAIDLEKVESNPVDALRGILRRLGHSKGGRALADPSRNIRPFETADEIARLLGASAARPWIAEDDGRASESGDGYLVTLLLLDAGLRLGEVCGLTWGDVLFGRDGNDTGRALLIRQTRARGRHDGAPKSGRERRVALSRRLRSSLLERYMAAGRPSNGERVLPGLDPANYRHRHFARACTSAKLGGGRSPKDLRSTFGSQLLSAGLQLAYVSAQLGHSNVATTARHYAKWIGSEYRAALALEPGEVPADLLARLPKVADVRAVDAAS